TFTWGGLAACNLNVSAFGPSSNPPSFGMTLVAGFACCSACNQPVKTSYTVTDANGSHAITLGGSLCYTFTRGSVLTGFCAGGPSTAPTDVYYLLTCGAD